MVKTGDYCSVGLVLPNSKSNFPDLGDDCMVMDADDLKKLSPYHKDVPRLRGYYQACFMLSFDRYQNIIVEDSAVHELNAEALNVAHHLYYLGIMNQENYEKAHKKKLVKLFYQKDYLGRTLGVDILLAEWLKVWIGVI